MRNVYIVGIGMGNPDTVTLQGQKIISECSLLIGAERMIKSFLLAGQKAVYAIKAEDIWKAIEENGEAQNIAVLMSGDTGFFSGAKKLGQLINEKDAENQEKREGSSNNNLKYIPGISSLSYFSAKTGMSWEDAKVVSLHGRSDSPEANVRNHHKVFFLTDGGENTVKNICIRLASSGMGETEVYVGERLSYEDEKISVGTAQELSQRDFEPLSVMIVLNRNIPHREKDTPGISDEKFIRGSVPMTKEEVRTLSVSKLNLKETDIAYDVGAGTGSVSVEMAVVCRYGNVYAVETNPDAVELLKLNKKKFQTDNLDIIQAMAPEGLEELPPPDKAFIGGSKGNLEEIISSLLKKNPHVRIVINVVTLESLAEAVVCIKRFDFEDVDIVQVNISKAKTLGNYNLMMAQNPVYIISLQGLPDSGAPCKKTNRSRII